MREFLVARNPNRRSKLPFLLCLPLKDAPLWLMAAQDWPRAASVYCHPLPNDPKADELEIIQRVGAVVCRQIGKSVDLVLNRGINKRSQFIFVRNWRGRSLILWQTSLSVKAVRPGLRIPSVRACSQQVVYIDTRERYGYTFANQDVKTERRPLPVGDYAVAVEDRTLGVVERKSMDDFVRSFVDGSLSFCMAELAALPASAVAIEGKYSELLRHERVRSGLLPDLLARLQVRYPKVSINFLETRKIAEAWTYHFLRIVRDNESATLSLLDSREVE